jgi:hypothetical protein
MQPRRLIDLARARHFLFVAEGQLKTEPSVVKVGMPVSPLLPTAQGDQSQAVVQCLTPTGRVIRR